MNTKRYAYFLFITLASVPSFAQQQSRTLAGRVFSASKHQAIGGAYIYLKKSGTATRSDETGAFSLSYSMVPDTVCVLAAGFRPYFMPMTQGFTNQIAIALKDSVVILDEVVVQTGYQSLPRERATGSFVKIDSSQFNQQVTPYILDRLESIAGGLSVDRRTGKPGLRIRGFSSIRASNSPLIVVDNFPYSGNIDDINPNMVESITVLKDAAAASIWGVRAGNGVIVITMKKGKFNQPLTVNFSTNITVGTKPALSHIQDLDAANYTSVETFLYQKGYYKNLLTDVLRRPVSPVVEILSMLDKGQITQSNARAAIDSISSGSLKTDLSKYVYRPAVNQQYALQLRAGSDKSAWIASLGVDRNLDELSSTYNRLNLHLENNFQIAKGVQMISGIYYTAANTISGRTGYFGQLTSNGRLPSYTRLADFRGQPVAVLKDYRQRYLDTAGRGYLLDWNYYPLEDYMHARTTSNTADITLNEGIIYELFKGFSAQLQYRYERREQNNQTLYDEQSYYARNLINSFSQLDYANGSVKNIVPYGAIVDLSHSLLEAHAGRAQLSYKLTSGQFSTAIIAGAELRQDKTSSYTYRTYGYDPNILTESNVNYINSYPNFITRRLAFIPSLSGKGLLNNRFVSLFQNASLTWRQKYTLSISARRDASNIFGASTNDKWKLLWSSGLSWNLSSEPFYHITGLPYLKLRVTYGYSGNTDPGFSGETTIGYLSPNPYTLTPVAGFQNYSNPDLRWEQVGMFNAGLDFSAFNGALRGSLEYYHKSATDLLSMVPVDYTAVPSPVILRNIAAMQGNGIDVQLTTQNTNGRLAWSTVFNLSYYRDKVTRYYLSDPSANLFVLGSQPLVTGVEGKPLYSTFAYKWVGLDPVTGDPQGIYQKQISKDYNLLTGPATTTSDLVYKGSAFPIWFGNINNTLTWKNWMLTVGVTYKMGYYFRRSTIDYNALVTTRQGHPDYLTRWQKAGDELITDVPSFVYPVNSRRDNFYKSSEATIEKGDNVRLQYITLGYELNKQGKYRYPFRQIRFIINVNNLGIIWRANKRGLDPDYKETTLPPAKSITAGVNILF